jgi:probable rRNA maturation factor
VESPDDDSFSCWVNAALSGAPGYPEGNASELSIRVTDESEMSTLNGHYRGRSGPTNVLSFPVELPEGVESELLGDIVICAPLVLSEAESQRKLPIAHWAHLTVHGVLHLLGYDHMDDSEAEEMETLETSILASLGFPDPYQSIATNSQGGVAAS